MMGLLEGHTVLDGLPFPSRPYYHGVPWFLAPSMFAYRMIDAIGFCGSRALFNLHNRCIACQYDNIGKLKASV
jgi:hypothetical protein